MKTGKNCLSQQFTPWLNPCSCITFSGIFVEIYFGWDIIEEEPYTKLPDKGE
jgi:hypothetical protein